MTKAAFTVSDFPSCCGLKIVSNIQKKSVYDPRTGDYLYPTIQQSIEETNTLLALRQPHRYENVGQNSSLLILNAVQKKGFEELLVKDGYVLIHEFKNWNENGQPLYMYFKEGYWTKRKGKDIPRGTETRE